MRKLLLTVSALSIVLASQLALAKPLQCPTAEQVNQANLIFKTPELDDWIDDWSDPDNIYSTESVVVDLNIPGSSTHWYLELADISANDPAEAKSIAEGLQHTLTSAGNDPLTSPNFTYCPYMTKDGKEAKLWLVY